MYKHTWVVPLTSHISYAGRQYRKSRVPNQTCDCSVCNSRMGGKEHKKGEKCLRKVGKVFYQTKKVFLSGKKDLKPMQKTERKTEKPQTDKALPSGVASSVVKESFLWLGFKRPSTYWG